MRVIPSLPARTTNHCHGVDHDAAWARAGLDKVLSRLARQQQLVSPLQLQRASGIAGDDGVFHLCAELIAGVASAYERWACG